MKDETKAEFDKLHARITDLENKLDAATKKEEDDFDED